MLKGRGPNAEELSLTAGWVSVPDLGEITDQPRAAPVSIFLRHGGSHWTSNVPRITSLQSTGCGDPPLLNSPRRRSPCLETESLHPH